MIDLKVTLSPETRVGEVDFDNIPFGKILTDHMVTADYVDGEWTNFELKPVEPLVMMPSNLAIHYGQSIFEGMKASLSHDGTPLLFRPEMHARRFSNSAVRMCMPRFPEDVFVELVRKLISVDRAWLPPQTGSSLYIRPFMFASDEYIGVKASDGYKFMIITLPAGPYYSRPISLVTPKHYVRAVEGGVGETKCAGNYGAAMYPTQLAQKMGFDQVLWLDAKEYKYVQEVGTMNIFFVIGDKVITPATGGTILKGITRASIVEILRSEGYEVEERPVTIDELVEAHAQGQLKEVFGSGTAALVAYVNSITHRDVTMKLDVDAYVVAPKAKAIINGLRDGTYEDKWGWISPINEKVMERELESF